MYKKPILSKLLTKKDKKEMVIGIFGLHRSSGGTHLAILLSEYIRGFCGGQVELIEASGRHDFVSIAEKLQINCMYTQYKKTFLYRNISFATQISDKNIGIIINDNYNYYVLDLGSDYRKAKEELMRCDQKIIIGNFAPWNEYAWDNLEHILVEVKNYESWNVISNLSLRLSTKQLKFPCNCNMLGFEPNLFHPSKRAISLFQKLIP